MYLRLARLWLGWILLVALGGAAPIDSAAVRRAGLDPERLALIATRLQEFVDQREISGAVVLVGRREGIAYSEAVGMADLEKRRPMQPGTAFQIMSMTKPITCLGLMILQEQGKLALLDPVEKHLPEFRGQMLVASRSGGTLHLKKPSRPMTIRDLMTHTSGMPGSQPPGLSELLHKLDRPLAEAVLVYSQQPLEFEPGTQWRYSNQGIATLGRIIEVVSGQPYAEFMRRSIFEPLDMKDSAFFPAAELGGRLAMNYRRTGQGSLEEVNDHYGGDPRKFRQSGKYAMPEGGLISTAQDLAKLYQMMLNRGQYPGGRLLSPVSVETMTRLHTGDIATGFTPGMGYGLGWAVVRDAEGTAQLLSEGSYGHGGAFGTQVWIDPKRNIYFVLMIQRVGLPNGDRSDIRHAVQTIALSSLVE